MTCWSDLLVTVVWKSMEDATMISTRGRYALRVMIDLAEHQSDDYIPMKTVANRQGISLKYLEQIMPVLTKNGLVEAVHGRGGGYRLARKPEDYLAGEILRLTEGDLTSVACLTEGATVCEKAEKCKTIGFWKGLNDVINHYLDSVSLADFSEKMI